MGEDDVLVTKEKMIDSDSGKVNVNTKADTSEASDTSNGSKINSPKIDVKRGIGKSCVVAITLAWRVSLRQHSLYGTQLACEDSDTGKFDATIDVKKMQIRGKGRGNKS